MFRIQKRRSDFRAGLKSRPASRRLLGVSSIEKLSVGYAGPAKNRKKAKQHEGAKPILPNDNEFLALHYSFDRPPHKSFEVMRLLLSNRSDSSLLQCPPSDADGLRVQVGHNQTVCYQAIPGYEFPKARFRAHRYGQTSWPRTFRNSKRSANVL